MKGRRGRRRKQLLDDVKGNENILEIDRGRASSHSVENSLWKWIWTFRKTDCRMNESHVKVFGGRVLLPAHTILSCLFSKMRRSWRPCTISSPIQNRAVRF
jgi:hypothetical protein